MRPDTAADDLTFSSGPLGARFYWPLLTPSWRDAMLAATSSRCPTTSAHPTGAVAAFTP